MTELYLNEHGAFSINYYPYTDNKTTTITKWNSEK